MNPIVIKRDRYLEQLQLRRHNGMVKVITGIRRSGKSYLLKELFYRCLLDDGVDPNHIIYISFDERRNSPLTDPDALCTYISDMLKDRDMYYLLLDEVQLLREFESVLNEFLHYGNVDIYVTGSNSRFLSTDVLTEFRGRGDEIHVYPLSFGEFLTVYNGSINRAWEEYYTYGGLPQLCSMTTDEQKSEYLMHLMDEVYLKDIAERNTVRHPGVLSELADILASASGSLTNPTKLANTFKSAENITVNVNTITRYIEYLEQGFVINKAVRYNIKGRKYIGSPYKYYFEDVGLRNARLNFRQTEENHLMENIIYNELRYRGFHVDVGIVEHSVKVDGSYTSRRYEVDFVANLGSKRYYIQSAFRMDSAEKAAQELHSLDYIDDSFKKIIVVRDDIKLRRNEKGYVTMGIFEFLCNPGSLDL